MNQILRPDGEPAETEQEQDDCEHKNKQTFQCAGPSPERTVCVDCGKEL